MVRLREARWMDFVPNFFDPESYWIGWWVHDPTGKRVPCIFMAHEDSPEMRRACKEMGYRALYDLVNLDNPPDHPERRRPRPPKR